MSESEKWMHEAAGEAKQALCLRDKCGAVLVKDGEVIGHGYNAPPRDDVRSRMCGRTFKHDRKPKSDVTCCMHAEWRTILDAMARNPDKIAGSTLYFTRVDEGGNILKSGDPYCTVCSRLALDTGIQDFALWQEQGIRLYPAEEYNRLSYEFHK